MQVMAFSEILFQFILEMNTFTEISMNVQHFPITNMRKIHQQLDRFAHMSVSTPLDHIFADVPIIPICMMINALVNKTFAVIWVT